MEYVIYLSKSKIDMLYEQIHRTKGKVKAEGVVTLGIVSAKIEKESKEELNYFEKLERVTEHIQDSIGRITDATIPSYISEEIPLVWRVPNTEPQVSYWVGDLEDRNLHIYCLLIGSSKNLLGASSDSGFLPYSNLRWFLSTYKSELEIDPKKKNHETIAKKQMDYSDLSRMVYQLNENEIGINSEKASYRFLAKCLYYVDYKEEEGINRFVVASPLYVSCN